MRYRQRIDGEGFTVPNGQVTRWACCDCGLVHDLAFVTVDGEIGVAARQNRRATAARRRSLNANLQQTTGAEPQRGSATKGASLPNLHQRTRDMSMVEKVAKGLFARSVEIDFKGTLTADWEGLAPEVKDFWRALARAAIEAMREPTEGMKLAGKEADESLPVVVSENSVAAGMIWQAMIQAALEGEG